MSIYFVKHFIISRYNVWIWKCFPIICKIRRKTNKQTPQQNKTETKAKHIMFAVARTHCTLATKFARIFFFFFFFLLICVLKTHNSGTIVKISHFCQFFGFFPLRNVFYPLDALHKKISGAATENRPFTRDHTLFLLENLLATASNRC